MEFTHERTKRFAKDAFNADLEGIYKRFSIKARFILPREWVVNELNARKRKEENKEKIKELPLIGKMLYRYMPYYRSYESEFLLTLMDKLGLDHLAKNSLEFIMENREEIYEKHFRTQYEDKYTKKLDEYMIKVKKLEK